MSFTWPACQHGLTGKWHFRFSHLCLRSSNASFLPYRAKTCPECRHKTTRANVIRVYYNVSSYSDNSVLETNAGSDVALLQSENDNLKFKLLEQDAQTKSFQEQMSQLVVENAEIKTKQRQTKQIIVALEQKNEQLKILQETHCDQVSERRARTSAAVLHRIKCFWFAFLRLDRWNIVSPKSTGCNSVLTKPIKSWVQWRPWNRCCTERKKTPKLCWMRNVRRWNWQPWRRHWNENWTPSKRDTSRCAAVRKMWPRIWDDAKMKNCKSLRLVKSDEKII